MQMQRKLVFLVFAVVVAATFMLIQAAANFSVRINSNLFIVYPTPAPTPTPSPAPSPIPTPTPTPTPVLQIGVYKDAGCTEALTSINWGELSLGESRNFTCYTRNEGTVPVTLYTQTENWSPLAAASYIRLTWDCEGKILPQDTIIPATFTLAVDPAIQGVNTFSFDIIIIAEG